MSLVHRNADGKPVPVLRWSPTKWRKAEALRDRLMRGAGTAEDWITEGHSAQFGDRAVAVHYRKPLSMQEVAKMAATPETIARPGRA